MQLYKAVALPLKLIAPLLLGNCKEFSKLNGLTEKKKKNLI